MAYYNVAAEPYQEQVGGKAGETSPDDLKAFYADMEKRDMERKMSKRKSYTGTSIWSRKSVKRAQPTTAASPGSQQQRPPPTTETTSKSAQQDNAVPPDSERPAADSDDRHIDKLEETRDVATPLIMSRSIVPDAISELPTWFAKDDAATYGMRYHLHNPVGPRRYYNHHLIPPSAKKPSSRPSSIFSPSFPPMATSSSQDSDDLTRLPGPSRTPSNSPLPTPSSSQADVGGKPRSRKTSQTAADGVDLLDVSDPWGTNWHHHSPYDIGLSHNSNSVPVDAQDTNQQRSRHASMTTRETRRRTVTPSPLSQSTSAVHLAPPSDGSRMGRKFSKRRTSTLGLWGNGNAKSSSAPVTPLDGKRTSMAVDPNDSLLSPGSALPNSLKPASLTSKQGRRGSVFGRLAKKFSILRKPHHVEQNDGQALFVSRSHSPEKPTAPKRVPPPSVDDSPPAVETPTSSSTAEEEPLAEASHRLSLASVELPFSMGRLTIANPDTASIDSTPHQQTIPLPYEAASSVPPEQSILQVPLSESPEHAPTLTAASPPPPISVHSSQSSTVRAPSMGTASPVPSSSMHVLSETMKPEVRSSPQKLEIGSPTRLRDRRASSTTEPASPSSKRSSETNGAAFPTAASPVANGHSQEKRKSRSPEKKPVPPMVPSKSIPAAPVPSSTPHNLPPPPQLLHEGPVPSYLSSMISTYPRDFVDNSPMSAASVLCNPPTPHAASDRPMPSSPAPTLPPKDLPKEHKRTTREPSPSGVSKQTETFKLVRSVSGSVYASTETIIAAGQQWEVVEDSKKGKSRDFPSTKSQSKSSMRDKSEGSSRREHRKDKERTEERESRRSHKGSRRSADVAGSSVSQSSAPRRSYSVEVRDRAPIPDPSKSERKSVDVPVNVNKPQPPPPPQTPGLSHGRALDRNPSQSARPISEVPLAADLNALKGREAWEMDRLFKAQSLYGVGAATAVVSASTLPAQAPVPYTDVNPHGSSHTSYTVQNAFPRQSSFPHSQSFPQNVDRTANGASSPSLPATHSSPADLLPLSRPNPLPEPPRESSYQPVNIDALLDTSAEHWTKYASVTTAH